MKTEYIGIDYGLGKTNIDNETGIRYGVIPAHALINCGADSLEPFYTETSDESDDIIGYEPIGYSYLGENYKCYQAFDNSDVFIEKSDYYTKAQFCSPCAPGACYLLNDCDNGAKAYCFNHDWFEENKAPYTVYRVSDNSIVLPGDK